MNPKQVIRQQEQQQATNCEYCFQKQAEIFQITGYYC
jgi:hypothetical protein